MPIPNHTIPEQFKQAVQIYFLIYNSVNRFNILIKGPVLKERKFLPDFNTCTEAKWLKSENSAKWFGIGTHSLIFIYSVCHPLPSLCMSLCMSFFISGGCDSFIFSSLFILMKYFGTKPKF